MPHPRLKARTINGGSVKAITDGWRLSIPAGQDSIYRLAQLDDYADFSRPAFPWHPPVQLRLRARASHSVSPGTWGFGLWNDPFGFSLGFGAGARFLALPQAAWFFFASPENHLSLLQASPASGSMAALIRSNPFAYLLSPLALLATPFLLFRPVARLLRRAATRLIRQEGVALSLDPRVWHSYYLNWEADKVSFRLDEGEILTTGLSPRAVLGLVLWIDNQYAAWRPDGSLGYGVLPTNGENWIEIQDLHLTPD